MACAQMEEASPRSARLHWLDIGRAFLSEDGSQLRPELQFDGTHMAPPFLQHVGAALVRILQPSKKAGGQHQLQLVDQCGLPGHMPVT